MKKALSIIIVAMMIMSMATSVIALPKQNEDIRPAMAMDSHQNPLYADVVYARPFAKDNTPVQKSKSTVVSTTNAFIKAIYTAMINRKTTVNIYYKGDWTKAYRGDAGELLDRVFAIDNKKTSDDSDYLRAGYSECNIDYRYTSSWADFTLRFQYTETKAQVNKVNARVKKELSKMKINSLNTVQKIKAIHDFIVNRFTYDQSMQHHSAYNGLFHGTSVCQGYAALTYKMMTDAGVPCRFITGYAGESHSWNIVRIANAWYNLDTTWDDPISREPILRYDYFLKGSSRFNKDHTRDPQYNTAAFCKKYPTSKSDYDLSKIKNPTDISKPQRITITSNPDAFVLTVGETADWEVEVKPSKYADQVYYAIDDESVVIVNKEDRIEAVAPGVTTICLWVDGAEDSMIEVPVIVWE